MGSKKSSPGWFFSSQLGALLAVLLNACVAETCGDAFRGDNIGVGYLFALGLVGFVALTSFASIAAGVVGAGAFAGRSLRLRAIGAMVTVAAVVAAYGATRATGLAFCRYHSGWWCDLPPREARLQ